MKKTLLFLMLVILTLVVVAGCSTSAQTSGQNGNYYVPAGNGCGVAGPEPTIGNEVVVVSDTTIFETF